MFYWLTTVDKTGFFWFTIKRDKFPIIISQRRRKIMAFCTKCGSEVAEGTKFCPSCGAPTEAAAAGQAQQTQNTQQAQGAQQTANQGVQMSFDSADRTAEFDAQDIQNNKVMAVLAYLSWLVLIPLFAAKDSKFARFHANQGLVLAITEIVYWVAVGIIGGILTAISGWFGIFVAILRLANIAFLVFTILGIVNAANGKAKELPLIGQFKILK